jgi:hypothetical protein
MHVIKKGLALQKVTISDPEELLAYNLRDTPQFYYLSVFFIHL